jgi:hypothetical protein
MANFAMGLAPGFECDLVYTPSNGRVTGLRVNDTNAFPCYAEASLENGNVFGQVFQPGDTTLNIPNNLVTLRLGPTGEPTFTGLAGVTTRVPA